IGLVVTRVVYDRTTSRGSYRAGGMPIYAIAQLEDLPRRTALTLLVPKALVAAAIVVLEPGYGFGAVPMVIVAACAGLMMPLGPALGVLAAQSLVLLRAGLAPTRDGLVTVAS